MTQSEVRKKFIAAKPGVKRLGHNGYWYRCAHCGKWCGRGSGIPHDQLMEVDHITPWSSGGSDELYNLQPLCRPCNRSKSNNMTFKDNIKAVKNIITHPSSLISTPVKAAARKNKILKGLGITNRK